MDESMAYEPEWYAVLKQAASELDEAEAPIAAPYRLGLVQGGA